MAVFLFSPYVAFAQDASATFFQRIIWSILTTITGTILWICAMLFDFSVNTFVIGFGDLYLGSGIGVAVDRIWFILRDFVNMFFIFGLVYIGFKMILDIDNSNTRRWLVNLIIAAVLINFSLLITKTVVDFSNQIATQIAISGFPDTGTTVSTIGSTPTVDLANGILGMMGIKSLLNLGIGEVAQGGWGYIFGTAIFFLITAFVLAAGAFLLMIRFIALTFFLLVSPLMFVSWVLPPVSETMHRYWKAFLSRAFFAPIYFLFIYFSLETLVGLQESLGLSSGGGKWANTFSTTGAGGNAALAAGQSTLPYFFIICGFMIGSLMIAQKLGANGADGAMSMGKSLKNKAISYSKKGAGSATLGVAGAVGQRTVGRGAHALANNQSMQKWAAGSKVGRAALGATRGVANSSFDARQVGGLGKSMGIGEGTKGGFSSRVKERKEKDEKFMKSLDDANMEDPENKRRAAALAAEKSAAANQEIDNANDTKQLAENDIETVEAVRANEGKSESELVGEMSKLEEQIVTLNVSMRDRAANGTITTQEKADMERRLEEKRVELRSKTLAKEDVVKQKALANEINRAKSAENAAIDPAQKAIHRERRQQLEKELATNKDLAKRESKSKQDIIQANKDLTKATEDVAKATKEATEEIKYENRVTFMETAKKKASGKYATAGDKESLSNLQKKFGKNASEMSKKASDSAAEKKLAEQLAEIQKNAGVGGEKKEEKKEGGDAH